MKLVMGTGWYANHDLRDYKTYGSDKIRANSFREIWWQGVNRFLSPDAVVIVDSASPVKPNDLQTRNYPVQNIVLLTNPGHSTKTSFHYSGWTASVILSLEYAYLSGADAYIYVEQDVALWAQDKSKLRKRVIEALDQCPFVFGSGRGTPQVLQQSFFAIHRRGMRQFLAGLHRIETSDRDLSPETKFHIALATGFMKPILRLLSNTRWLEKVPTLLLRRIFSRIQGLIRKMLMELTRNYQVWDFGYGRSRPINFDDDVFYFQHGSEDELMQYREKMRIASGVDR
jgi:hypothetical protein